SDIIIPDSTKEVTLVLAAREASTSAQLEATRATIFDLDYLDEGSIAAAAQSYGNDKALDVLVNCGGIEMYPERWLDTIAESLIYKYNVMTVGLFLASKYFLPSLKKSEFGTIVNLTSEWASIAEQANDCGTHISYCIPKSALNALSISVAIELKAEKENTAVLYIDPGDVPTKLSRWAGDIDLNDSIQGIYE
ncbi:hypothetical protein V491_01905, partial [Pseudogymnoascus sp. VKM F-3775]